MENKKETFEYTYSAKQQQEIENIRKKYLPKEEDKMEQLRRLDRSATKKGTMVSIILGTVSTLILGVGMCCTMVWSENWFVPGIIIGFTGIAGNAALVLLLEKTPLNEYGLSDKRVEKLS